MPIPLRTRIPENVIQELVRQIVDQFQPERIILFGSYARGNPRPESDIDLLIVMQTDQREMQQALAIRQKINPLFGVDLLVYTPDRLEQRLNLADSFLREILDQGLILYESPGT